MVELRINDQLCDLSDDFQITLKRVFYDPKQLITKDAQKSYSISLPATDTNKRIFGFKNVQEAKDRFKSLYDATLNIDGQLIFDGKFKFSEITPERFSGNLLVLFKYSLKDILGDKFMNECGDWYIPFKDFNESVKLYNERTNSECIFPLVMYGLLPKKADAEGNYSAKNIYDSTVAFNIGAFPPSINCLQMLQRTFTYFGLDLAGTAFDDPKLNKLYMSYKNPSEYEMEWNYGYNALIKLNGSWSNYKNLNAEHDPYDWRVEPTTSVNENPKDKGTAAIYTTDLLANVNGKVEVTTDNGGNVSAERIYADENNIPDHISRKVRIPYTGYYKVRLETSVKYKAENTYNRDKSERFGNKTISILSPYFYNVNDPENTKVTSDITRRRLEVKVVRDRVNGGFDFDQMDIDMAYYEDAIDQTPNFDTNQPKYYPQGGETCLIDPAQTKQLVCGVGFGKGYDDRFNAYSERYGVQKYKYTNPIAMKGGYSYDSTDTDFQHTATPSMGYVKCVLDESGNPIYEASDKYRVEVNNANCNSFIYDDLWGGEGYVETIVWLARGEELSVVHTADLDHNIWTGRYGSVTQDVTFGLSIEPYKKEQSWLTDKLTDNGETIVEIDYNGKTDFESEKINLIKFLPSNVKINNWVTNFCNAFNLALIQIDDTHYQLNINKRLAKYGGQYINITPSLHTGYLPRYIPLEIPYIYDLGFTINDEEQGYTETKENGGGKIETWRSYGNTLTQTSDFSYCWYKDITFDVSTVHDTLKIPIISDKEPFDLDNPRDYAEMSKKDYSDYAQRFWYKADNIILPNVNNAELTATLVKGDLEGEITLDYHDEDRSILRNYFAVITGSETSCTEVVCYISQWQFNLLSNTFVIYNNDLFFVSSIESFNPITRIAQLRLIRKSIL